MMLPATLLACFALALAAPLVVRRLGARAAWLLAALPAGFTVYFGSLLAAAARGQAQRFAVAWVPPLHLNFSLRADGLSLLFALLISGVGTLVVLYAGSYLQSHRHLARFFGWLLFFMTAMLGVVLADNLLLVYVFWELTSISSFMLIGFEHEDAAARAAARQALLVTTGGGLAMLAGFVLLGQAAGTLELPALLAQAPALRASPLYLPAVVLILLGAFSKSAQFPFHFWLPNAMQAPTPVSAYLHSATMVKAGVYLIARLGPVLGGTPLWTTLVGGVGLATLLVGGLLALSQTDLKRLLAYSTISALGLMVGLLGLGTNHAVEAALVFLLGHGLYKGALFMVAGVVDHETGTRDVTRLGGLIRVLPLVGGAALAAGLSVAGVPPLFGYIGKELAYSAALEQGPWVAAAVVLGGVLFVYVALASAAGPFLGRRVQAPHLPNHALPAGLWLGPVVLAALSLLLGLAPGLIGNLLFSAAASAALGRAAPVQLALWHGPNWALGLSVLSLALGAGLFLLRQPLRQALGRLRWPWGPQWAYTTGSAGLRRLALGQTRLLQTGYLRHYLLVTLVATTGLAAFTLWSFGGVGWPSLGADLYYPELVLVVLVLVGAVIVITSPSRLGAVAALGVTGYAVSLIYLVYGAPDLAMTQFLIESLTVILFVLAFYHLPRFTQISSRRTRWRDAAIALLSGGLVTTLVLSAADINWFPSIAGFFAANAVPGGHGRNVVNVILVDFRGFDTLGEVTVLSAAALGVYALLKLRKRDDP